MHRENDGPRVWRALRKMRRVPLAVLPLLCALGWQNPSAAADSAPWQSSSAPVPFAAPATRRTGGLEGPGAYEHVRHLVELGPRPPDSEAIHAAQAYIVSQLKGSGCP